MTAPTRTRTKSTSSSKRSTRPERESGGERGHTRSTRGSGAGSRSSAAERAYARREQRAQQAKRATSGDSGSGDRSGQGLRSRLRPRLPRSRTSFVLLIMAMLAAGVVVTLWLSTQTIAGSYKLERLHKANSELSEQVAQLERVVTTRESAPWLAEHAQELGMVPGPIPAKLVVHKDGSVTVVGEPQQATDPSSDSSDSSDSSGSAGSSGSEQESAGDDSENGGESGDESGGGEAGQDSVPAGEER